MNFDDYKRTMLDIETPSGLNARTYSRIVQKDAGELLEEEPYVEPYAISAKAGRRPRKRYYVGIGVCAAAALVGALIVVVLGTSAPQTSPAHSAAPPASSADEAAVAAAQSDDAPRATVSSLGLSPSDGGIAAMYELTVWLPWESSGEGEVEVSWGPSAGIGIGPLGSSADGSFSGSVHLAPVSGCLSFESRVVVNESALEACGLTRDCVFESSDDYAALEKLALDTLASSTLEVAGSEIRCYRLTEAKLGDQLLCDVSSGS